MLIHQSGILVRFSHFLSVCQNFHQHRLYTLNCMYTLNFLYEFPCGIGPKLANLHALGLLCVFEPCVSNRYAFFFLKFLKSMYLENKVGQRQHICL